MIKENKFFLGDDVFIIECRGEKIDNKLGDVIEVI